MKTKKATAKYETRGVHESFLLPAHMFDTHQARVFTSGLALGAVATVVYIFITNIQLLGMLTVQALN